MMVDAGFDNTGHDSGERGAEGRDDPDLGGAESGAGTTGELPDPRKLAQDWITLWQSELSAMAADPEMREIVADRDGVLGRDHVRDASRPAARGPLGTARQSCR